MHYTNWFAYGTPRKERLSIKVSSVRFIAEMVDETLELRLVINDKVLRVDDLDPLLLVPGKRNLGKKFKASDLVTFEIKDENSGVFWYNNRKYNFSLVRLKNTVRKEAPNLFAR